MNKKIIIGSRGSKLAMLYAEKAKDKIVKTTDFSDEEVVIKKITTKGDEFQDVRLSEVGGKGLFSSCLLYTSPSPRDLMRSRMPSSA